MHEHSEKTTNAQPRRHLADIFASGTTAAVVLLFSGPVLVLPTARRINRILGRYGLSWLFVVHSMT